MLKLLGQTNTLFPKICAFGLFLCISMFRCAFSVDLLHMLTWLTSCLILRNIQNRHIFYHCTASERQVLKLRAKYHSYVS